MLKNLYQNHLLKYPKTVLAVMAVFVLIMTIFAFKLEIDASAETLLLEDDKDLEYSRDVIKRFEAPNFLVVTYSIEDDLLSEKNINNIKMLGSQIQKIEIVESINSIINVPLLQSPPQPIKELVKNIPTLQTQNIDKELVKKEFLNSALYKQNLVSDDFKTTAILVNLKRDEKYFSLINERDSYVKLKKERVLTKDEKSSYEKTALELKKHRDILRERNHLSITEIREILQNFESTHKGIKLHLGGVDMIADDMIEFVKYDLRIFGSIMLLLLIAIIYLLLRDVKWVAIALLICSVSMVITSGILGILGLEVTVVSSNFISLQLIINMSLILHLIVKYRELQEKHPEETQENLILNTVSLMALPSFYVVITTVAGFSSLVFSGILPVINFGWMMSLGSVISLFITFIIFPLSLIFFKNEKHNSLLAEKDSFTSKVARVVDNYRKTILFATIFVALFSITGAMKLRVENSFIDYFKQDTYIYKGMALIDQKLGGTTPLDIVLTFKEQSDEVETVKVVQDEDNAELDSFSDEFEEKEGDKEQYWFTQNKMQKIKEVHDYLDSLEAIGKVLSLSTTGEILKVLNDGKEADGLTLALMYKELPVEYKKIIITPYIDIKNNQARISTRVIDSLPKLQRDELIKKINSDLKKIVNPKYEEYKVTNILIMYNNMLQSLFNSQIKTIGAVVLILFLMFLALFRSFKIATVGMIANVIPVGVVFGFMGWMDIPLDMMTTTIAAIGLGIAVDNTIHYIYRYKIDYKESGDALAAMYSSHRSIGTAMFYTSTIIIVGFSILVLSSFLPTIYFGLLTAMVMFVAVVGDLLLLPVLLLIFGV